MKEIIARILATANLLDAANFTKEADKLTKIAQDFGDFDAAQDAIQQPMKCTHENVEYEGNDGEREVYRRCWGTCKDCGAELEGYEVIDGGDDDGRAEYGVVEWKEDTPLNQLMASADMLDKKGLHKFADTITKIAQEAYDPKAPGSANQYDPNIHRVVNDMEKMFTPAPQQDIYAELKTFLSTIAGINTNYTNGQEVMIGAGMANHIKSEAKRLLADLAEYTGEEDNQEGPTDEQLFGAAERNLDYQETRDKHYPESAMSGFPTTDWLDKYKSQ